MAISIEKELTGIIDTNLRTPIDPMEKAMLIEALAVYVRKQKKPAPAAKPAPAVAEAPPAKPRPSLLGRK